MCELVFFERYLNLKERLERKSHFLFGPRGTGKSSLWAHQLQNRCVPVNLLRGDLALRLSAHPEDLEAIVKAQMPAGEPINYAAIASDSEVPASSVREFYRILEDTLLGFQLEPWTGSVKRKAVQSSKFYFFDTGVRHTICRTKHLEPGSDLFGRSMEQWIGAEIRAWMSYSRNHDKLCYWRSKHGAEVDFLIGKDVAVEVKAAARVKKDHFKGLEMLGEEGRFSKRILVSLDPTASHVHGIDVWPWQRFLEEMWNGKLV